MTTLEALNSKLTRAVDILLAVMCVCAITGFFVSEIVPYVARNYPEVLSQMAVPTQRAAPLLTFEEKAQAFHWVLLDKIEDLTLKFHVLGGAFVVVLLLGVWWSISPREEKWWRQGVP